MKPFDLYSFLPDHFKTDEGTLLRGILSAVGVSQDRLAQMVEAAIDQQFLSTATGKYLLYLGESQGFVLPPNSGLDVRALRSLIPIAVASPKQVSNTLNSLIAAFYGNDKVRTAVIAQNAEPYSLVNGDDLIVETETQKVSVGFVASLFSDINNVSASELATLINTQQSLFVADAFLDRRLNKKFLRISSKIISVNSSIRVVGGTAQNVFKIPKIISTANSSSTSWVVTKNATYSDITRFTWDGVGSNPKIYEVSEGDLVTIRGLVGAALNLNGSYTVAGSGYDYFEIYNTPFQALTTSFAQPFNNSIVFTSQLKNTLYDLPEYAISVETLEDTVSFTVPAVPPIARRFIIGSAHLQGVELPVLDFTRSSISIDVTAAEFIPADTNSIVLANGNFRYDMDVKSTYRVAGSNSGTPRIYFNDNTDETYSVFPHTGVQPISTDAIYSEPQSEDYFITFPFPHGLRHRWGFTLGATSGSSNLSPVSLSSEFSVDAVVNSHTIRFKIRNSSGSPVFFEGISVGPFDLNQWGVSQTDGSDFYLEFPSSAAVLASGLRVGSIIRIDPNLGTNVNAFYANALRNKPFEIISIQNEKVNFAAGYGFGSIGLIISASYAKRSGGFGGSVSYFFDKTSTHNQAQVMSGLNAVFTEYSEPANPAFIGSFLYDPTGSKYQNTVSGAILKNADEILKGDNPVAIFVENVDNFPKSGKLLINYGTDRVEGPINYLSTIQNSSGNSQVLIDPSYKFKFTHNIGAGIWHIHKTSTYVPDTTGKDYPVYITGTARARNTLLQILKLLVASGIFIDFNVLFPNLRYADPSIQPYQ